MLERAFDTGVGEFAQGGQRLGQLGPAGEIAQRDAQHLAPAEQPQARLERGLIRHAGKLTRHAPGKLAALVGAQEVARFDELAQQLRVLRAGARDEIARGERLRQDAQPAFGVCARQARELLAEIAPVAFRHGTQGNWHARKRHIEQVLGGIEHGAIIPKGLRVYPGA